MSDVESNLRGQIVELRHDVTRLTYERDLAIAAVESQAKLIREQESALALYREPPEPVIREA